MSSKIFLDLFIFLSGELHLVSERCMLRLTSKKESTCLILFLETRAVPHYLPCQNKKYAAFARHQISTHVGTDFTPNLICVTAPSRGWKVNVLFDQQAGKHLCDPVILKPDLACTRGCRMASATKIYRAFGSCTSWHGFLVISEGFPLYKRMTENISNQTVSTIPLQKKEVKADQQT